MNVQIYSLYWDNVDPRIPAAQKAVLDAMKLPLNQHRINGLPHGEWIDWVLARNDYIDAFLFLDVDCLPLTRASVLLGFEKVSSGMLYGAEGAANHLDPTRSYVGAWYAFINRRTWHDLGRPSAKETPSTDVLQLWTETWRQRGVPVDCLSPTACEEPKWDLPGRPQAYGIGTTYGEACYHLFQAREGTIGSFLKRAEEVAQRATQAQGG